METDTIILNTSESTVTYSMFRPVFTSLTSNYRFRKNIFHPQIIRFLFTEKSFSKGFWRIRLLN